MSEVWRPVPIAAYAGRYEVSSRGRVRSLLTGKVLRPGRTSKGYLSVQLYCGASPKRPRSYTVHRLVCLAFLGGPPFPKAEINHRDLDKANNRVENLEWCTGKQNMRHAVENGVYMGRSNVEKRKLTEAEVAEIRATDFRYGVQRQLAKRFGVHETVISQIKLGKTYRKCGRRDSNTRPPAWEASIRPADGDGGGQ